MRIERQSLSSVRERDTDFLLLEELTSTPEFRTWFLQNLVPSENRPTEFIDAWHSVYDSEFGESDIEFGVIRSDGSRLLVMIENKIDATFQEAQLERYQKRGEKSLDEDWDAFVTGLFAPEAYLEGTDRTETVDGVVSYEAVRKWFKDQASPRAIFKSGMLTDAIEQKRRGYTPEIDKDVSELHQYYWELSHDRYPELGMNRPDGVPAGNLWVRFNPHGIPKEINLIHKMGRGDVDLQFSGAAEDTDSFTNQYEPLLEEDMKIIPTGKSLSIRIEVPSISDTVDPEDQHDQIVAGIEAAHRSLTWYDTHGS